MTESPISDDQKHSTKHTRTHVTQLIETKSFHLKVTVLESLKKCCHVHDFTRIYNIIGKITSLSVNN